MASFTTGLSFTTGDAITSARLHQSVDDAILTNVGTTDLAPGLHIPSKSELSSGVTGQFVVDSEGLLEVLHNPSMTGDEDYYSPLGVFVGNNSSTVTVEPGDWVGFDGGAPGDLLLIASGANPDIGELGILGVALEEAGPNQPLPVRYKGQVIAKVQGFSGAVAGMLLTEANGVTGVAGPTTLTGIAYAGVWGKVLEQPPQSASTETRWCLVL